MGLLDNQTQQEYYDGNQHGFYQFISLQNIIDQFIIAYIGEDKIIPRAKRTDVMFHAKRAMQELSFDVFKSCKSLEMTLPSTLQMILPQDYVNYTKISSVDSSGIKHPLYPTSRTSNPTRYFQNSDGEFKITAIGTFTLGSSSVVLDGEYKNIVSGMTTDLHPNYVVKNTTTTGGITTVELTSSSGIVSGDRRINFFAASYELPFKVEDSVVLTGVSYPSPVSNIITAASASDAAKVEVGMVASHEHFYNNTIVVDVQGTKITLSQNTSNTATVSSANVNFVSYAESDTWENYKSHIPTEIKNDSYEDDTYWPLDGSRYGLDPQHAQVNGSYYIDCTAGKIHFSSNLNGKIIVLDYLSDGLGGDAIVHKFAEEAVYKHIAYAMLCARSNVPEFQVVRFKREKTTEIRRAKLRLSNIKLEEITQILRGKSKQIKH